MPSSLRAEERAVGRRRLGELLDLFAQRGDVLARLAQGVGQLLVLGDGLGQLALGLEQPLLERADPLRARPAGGAGATTTSSSRAFDLLAELGRARPRTSPSRRSCSVAHGDHLLRSTVRTLPPAFTALRRRMPMTSVDDRSATVASHALISPASPCKLRDGYDRRPIDRRRHRAKDPTRPMKVWIDQDLCTGDGLCEEIAPDVFTLLDDGLAYVKEGDKVFYATRAAPRASPTSPPARTTPSSSPPRSAPASASSSRPEHVRATRPRCSHQRKHRPVDTLRLVRRRHHRLQLVDSSSA